MNKNIKKLIKYPKKGILSEEIFKSKELEINLFCMAANTKMSEHTSIRKAMIHVLEGKGEFSLEGKNIEMLPGVLITMEENAVHSLKAEEKTAFLLFTWK